MTNAERRAVVERIEESLGGNAGRCLWSFAYDDGRVDMPLADNSWRLWPSEEAFLAHARAQGVESAVQERLLDLLTMDRESLASAVQFPDGVVVDELSPEREWPSLEALEQETGGLPFYLFRWRPAPASGAPAEPEMKEARHG